MAGNPCKIYLRTSKIEKDKDLRIHINLEDTTIHATFTIKALIDCGATDCFINQKLVEKKKLKVTNLAEPVPIYQSDGKILQPVT